MKHTKVTINRSDPFAPKQPYSLGRTKMKEKKRTIICKTIKDAESNAETIYRQIQGKKDESLWFAHRNEKAIVQLSKELIQAIELAKGRLDENMRYLNGGNIGCLNSCGVLQDLNHKIDTTIVLIQLHIKIRGEYIILL